MEANKLLARSRPRTSILDFDRDEIRNFIKKKLTEKGVNEAYLFGSFITNKVNAWSDVDLIIIQETDQPFIERPRSFSGLYDLGIPFDILVYTKAELKKQIKNKRGFWQDFEKNHLRIV